VHDVLSHHGYDVRVSADGEAGLRAMRDHPAALVLLDIQMPGASGFDVLRSLRSSGALAHVPVVAMTASVMNGDRGRMADAGFDAFLPKPISLRDLLSTVARLLPRPDPVE
jgi:CheY-like chemotaxis protein